MPVMRRLEVTTVIGARPQFVKAAAMSRAFGMDERFEERLIHTGQHSDFEMSGSFFEELGLPHPALNLGIGNLPHGAMTGRMIEGIEADLLAARPDCVLVYGDTNSTLAGAIAAVKQQIPVIHAESGMRSGRMDVPEEVNRILTDRISTLLLCASRQAMDNLEREGLAARACFTGDVMYDVALFAKDRAAQSVILSGLNVSRGEYSLLTVHRAENTNDASRLKTLLDYAVSDAAGRPIVFPVHPRTRAVAGKAAIDLSRFAATGPLGYLDFQALLAGAGRVLTDSGGVQKEAYFHRVPCVTLRDETEWTETLEAGWNRLWTSANYVTPRREIMDYGDGHAAESSLAAIWSALGAR